MKKKSKLVYDLALHEECENIPVVIGKRVRAWRKAFNITHFQFVQDIGVYAQGTISRKENCKKDKFSLADIYRICKVYNLPFDYFFKDHNYKSKEK